MSNKILPDGQAQSFSPVSWRKLDRREKPRPKTPEEAAAQSPAQEAENAIEAAYKRGFAQGVESCHTDAQEQVRALLERLTQSIQTLAELRPRMRHTAEEDLVKLSIAVARRILNRELSVDPSSIQGIIRVALEKLQSKEISRVRFHASHEAAIRNCLAAMGSTSQIQLAIDTTMQPGDLIFETTQGEFDASLDFQLREIERGFADRLNA